MKYATLNNGVNAMKVCGFFRYMTQKNANALFLMR